jgi:16S rRNA processing protein RimM
MTKSQNIHIGHCVSPHGIRGEFSFVIYNNESQSIKDNSQIFLKAISPASSIKDDFFKVTVASIRYGNKIIVSLKGISTRNEVESMIPFNIYCPRSDLPLLLDNEFYLHDLLGCKVINFVTKADIGTVVSFYENGEQLILQISNVDLKLEILFIKHFVPVVDVENKIIEIVLPEIVE